MGGTSAEKARNYCGSSRLRDGGEASLCFTSVHCDWILHILTLRPHGVQKMTPTERRNLVLRNYRITFPSSSKLSMNSLYELR